MNSFIYYSLFAGITLILIYELIRQNNWKILKKIDENMIHNFGKTDNDETIKELKNKIIVYENEIKNMLDLTIPEVSLIDIRTYVKNKKGEIIVYFFCFDKEDNPLPFRKDKQKNYINIKTIDINFFKEETYKNEIINVLMEITKKYSNVNIYVRFTSYSKAYHK